MRLMYLCSVVEAKSQSSEVKHNQDDYLYQMFKPRLCTLAHREDLKLIYSIFSIALFLYREFLGVKAPRSPQFVWCKLYI